jgi:deoxyribonuclease-4
MELLFGTGGTPLSAVSRSTVSGIERIAALGLGCMEVEFVHGVHMGTETAQQVFETARRLNVRLTCHAPYFINLNSMEPEKVEASKYRLIQAARVAAICGVESIVFHTAVYSAMPPEQVYATVKKHIEAIYQQLARERVRITLRPEVLGKQAQFGTIDEIFSLCRDIEGLLPCIDFAHWHARTGQYNTYPEFVSVLQKLESQLGTKEIGRAHV